MTHDQMKETMACQVCGKPERLSVDECHATIGRQNPLCNEYEKCRIAEKSEPQFNYALSGVDKNIFLKACPGSGKTEVVGLKTAYEIKRWDKEVGGIAVLTFTNNAADVISERVSQFAGVEKIKYPHFIGTFDSWLHGYIAHPVGHLRTEYKGRNGDFSFRLISDKNESVWPKERHKLKISYYSLNETNGRIRSMPLYANMVRYCFKKKLWEIRTTHSGRNSYISDHDYYNSNAFVKKRKDTNWTSSLHDMIEGFYEKKRSMLAEGFATYHDLENICYRLLEKKQTFVEKLSLRFPLIIVDECQDLSWIQLEILKKLKDANSKLHFIGDLNQAIYGFKEVAPEKVQEFVEREKFNKKPLSDNFRSCQTVVDLCQRLVISNSNVRGMAEQKLEESCVCLVYKNKNDLSKLPSWFENHLKKEKLDVKKSAILTRGWSNVNRMRPSRDDAKINTPFARLAKAIHLWETGEIQAIGNAIEYMGQFFSEKYFGNWQANSRKHYCPECIDSGIQWRRFLMEVLEKCIQNKDLIDIDKTGSEWAKSVRKEFGQIAKDCKHYLISALTEDVIFPDKLTHSQNKKTKSLQVVFTATGSKVPVKETISVNSIEKAKICVTTIHSVKGETFDAIMVVSAPSTSGSKDNHWEHWLGDENPEAKRLAYVASSRPKYLLVWAVPQASDYSKLTDLGFKLINL